MVSQVHFSSWKPRVQQIYMAELTAVPFMLARHAAVFQDQDALFFIDNEGALAALIRGGSGEPDAEVVAHLVHSLATILNCRIWWDWVDSVSNPADALSRVGLFAEEVQQDLWDGECFTSCPTWSSSESPWAIARRLLDFNWAAAISRDPDAEQLQTDQAKIYQAAPTGLP